ncbi:uncharacterized protein BKA55DRAFT_693280 [Fusarium redolens]|uniref:Uncharacterized protein n=1 Tax=Fusarium redolens TaxID=48865 RepID=A0A9P9GK35_FUSRE|nr:uncharacterized protein BKA55DRAFT_693280 [Fusarium redolens]KAH7241039.1 hypothetical protein BKA55DRAFT_693280 [Fusarium redolens]
MADSSPETPAETPTNDQQGDQQGLRRSSRSNRGQLNQNRSLLQHYVVGEAAGRPIPGPGCRRTIAKPEADDDEDKSVPLAQSAHTASNNARRPRKQSQSNNLANFGSHEEAPALATGAVALGTPRRSSIPASHPRSPPLQQIGDRRRSASPPQFASPNMRDRQDLAPQQQIMSAFPREQAFQYGPQLSQYVLQHAPQSQNMAQQQIPSLPVSVQSAQMAPPQHVEQQTHESASNAPGVYVNPADLMLDTQPLVDPQMNNIQGSEIPQFAQLVELYNSIHEERRAQEERDRLAAQEKKDKAKAADAEEMDQEEMDALWAQFINSDAFK